MFTHTTTELQKVISITNGVARHPGRRMADPVSLDIMAGEQVAIVGPNGSGKSRLADIIAGASPLLGDAVRYDFRPSPLASPADNIRRIAFRDAYGDAAHSYYLQQRWNQHDIDPDTPTAGQLLDEAWAAASGAGDVGLPPQEHEAALARRRQLRATLWQLFGLDALSGRYIISLSSGELRKFQLARMLMAAPRVVIIDNPFVGLDADARGQLRDLLQSLCRHTDLQVILELCRDDEIPDFITHVVPVAPGMHLLPKRTRQAYLDGRTDGADATPADAKGGTDGLRALQADVLALPAKDFSSTPFYQPGGEVAAFCGVSIAYGGHTILDNVTWTIREGERWALSGPNGSGKSTLLSLICADNPQGYACNTRLFGHRRGTGESIWDIKRHIGYVSPEMHRAYMRDLPAEDIVASGLRDSVGLYARPRPEERTVCITWMRFLGIETLAGRSFLALSSGEQRLCLLARAFVKDPELLILDEPLHGLDDANRQRVRAIIDAFCQRPHKTLIMVTHYPDELPACISPGCHYHLTPPTPHATATTAAAATA